MMPGAEVILVGMGATLCIDLWASFLARVFGVRSLNYCLLGRWVLHMREGRVVHASIAASAPKPYECPVGWTAHYSIGIGLAMAFVMLARDGWLERPVLLPALAYGVATVVVPFLTMQPAFGLGIAGSKTPSPWKARLKSVMTHSVFGIGLWVSALLLSRVR